MEKSNAIVEVIGAVLFLAIVIVAVYNNLNEKE